MGDKYFFVLEIAVILLAAQVGGFLSEKLKQPAVLGQILAGLILGAGLLHKSEVTESFAQIGVIILMFIAGLETDVKELVRSAKSSSLIALGGVIAPAGLVFAAMMLLS
ncbi:MAG: cation:proton antiporter, partial [Bacillota bacterium]|nr:cation:proton antiporter [Bacillota bacterium]